MTPEEFLLRKERKNSVDAMFPYLPDIDRKIMIFRMEAPPLSYAKIGRRLGISTATAHRRFKNTIDKILLKLTLLGGDDETRYNE